MLTYEAKTIKAMTATATIMFKSSLWVYIIYLTHLIKQYITSDN